jgi:hypothetical protein
MASRYSMGWSRRWRLEFSMGRMIGQGSVTKFAVKLLPLAMLLLVCARPSAASPSGAGGMSVTLPRPVSTYNDRTKSGLPARLDYYPRASGPFLAFRIGEAPSPSKPAPTLEEEGAILDRLLGRLVAEHADLPPSFKFAPDTPALVTALDERLLQAGANWDPKRGTPRRGRSVDVLKAELGQVLGVSSVETAFESHGYRLVLIGISRIEMAAATRGGARLPAFISEMDITALRKDRADGATGQ